MATENKKPDDGRTVILKRVRMSFTESLKTAKPTIEGGEPKHTANIILEADSPTFEENKKKVIGALAAASKVAWDKPDRWKSISEDDPKRVAFRKGERFKNKDGEVYQGYDGNWAISAAGPRGGKKRPTMRDRRKRVIEVDEIETVVYGGVYADVKVSFYGTDKGGLGLFATIEGLRSHEEGTPMGGGGGDSADDYDDMDDGDSFDDDAGSDSFG